MNQPIIEITGLGKKYRIGAHKEPYLSLRDELAKPFRRLTSAFSHLSNSLFTTHYSQSPAIHNSQSPTTHNSPLTTHNSQQDFWALKDVSFSVNQGEAVGIIGRNGAGKSTLLKILSQITPPTEGKITCRGRIASLLEVGTGFHPELTGRENIYMNGAILGMRRAEITRKFDEIVAFAEVEQFLDTPVKRYSSGMYVRLAFAVAAHLEPEILIVDEVLAVGDAQFQKKCLGKMQDVAKGGRTVLFVSHNMTAVSSLCGRGILLREGRVQFNGPMEKAIDLYLARDYFLSSGQSLADRTDRSGSGAIRLQEICLIDECGKPVGSVPCGGACCIAFKYGGSAPVRFPQLAFTIRDVKGNYLFRPSSDDAGFDCEEWPSGGTVVCKLPQLNLIPGNYRITTEIRTGSEIVDYVEGAYSLEVHGADFFGTSRMNMHSPVLIAQQWSLCK